MCKDTSKEQYNQHVISETQTLIQAMTTTLWQYCQEKIESSEMPPDQVLICVLSALVKVEMEILENLVVSKAMKEGDFDTVYNSMTTQSFHPDISKAMLPMIEYLVKLTNANVLVMDKAKSGPEET